MTCIRKRSSSCPSATRGWTARDRDQVGKLRKYRLAERTWVSSSQLELSAKPPPYQISMYSCMFWCDGGVVVVVVVVVAAAAVVVVVVAALVNSCIAMIKGACPAAAGEPASCGRRPLRRDGREPSVRLVPARVVCSLP